MTKKQKKTLYRIIVTLILFVVVFYINHVGVKGISDNDVLMFVVCIIPYVIIGYDVVLKAFRNIRNGQVFDENFLMMIATFGAFGVKEYVEAVAVMLFYQVGELFQSYAVGKSRDSIKDLMELCPEYANIEVDGHVEEVDPDDVAVGSIIVIKPGERIPLDGVVLEGDSMIDTAAITGEFVPRRATVEDAVISGCINGSGTLRVKTTKEFEDSTVAKILELVENASSKKSKVENFITRFAKYYTPLVTIGAILCAIVPPLLLGGQWKVWIETACTFLVISCPCALVISVPLGFFGGIGAASKCGILIKGSNYLETASHINIVAMDKTGTLTVGEFVVQEVCVAENASYYEKYIDNHIGRDDVVEYMSIEKKRAKKDRLLEIAAYGEMYSNHPIAKSIQEAYRQIEGSEVLKLDTSRVNDSIDISGRGIEVYVDGEQLYLGNEKLMKSKGIKYNRCDKVGTIVYIATEDEYLGYIRISDTRKESTPSAIQSMRKSGINSVVMLTGDNKTTADMVASELKLDKAYSELLPEDKVRVVEKMIDDKKESDKLAFVGDGINDAPVLMRADVGIAMGAMGSDAAIEAADIVIMDDDISKIPTVIDISKKTLAIVKQNIVFALGVKGLVLILSMCHLVGMWGGVFADVGVAVLAILNSMRMLLVHRK